MARPRPAITVRYEGKTYYGALEMSQGLTDIKPLEGNRGPVKRPKN